MTTHLNNKLPKEAMLLMVNPKIFREIAKSLGACYAQGRYQVLNGKSINTITAFQNSEQVYGIYIEGKNHKETKKRIKKLLRDF